ncbi:hypothetical protein Tco_1235148 [Tanacetum coccineum]
MILFTFEVGIPRLPTIPGDMKEEDNSNDGDLDVYEPQICYDENDEIYAKAVIFVNKRLVRGDDEVELTDEEFSDPNNENTYNEFKNKWMNEWNKGIPWVPEEPCSENGIPIDDIHHICKPVRFKNGKAKWPLAIQTRKDSAMEENYRGWFKLEVIQEEKEPNDDHGIINFDNDLARDNASYQEEERYKEDRCKLLKNPCQEPPVCKIERFKLIKYSFGPTEKYIAIKECEHDDWQRTEYDACHAYREIFCIMDEGWFVTRAE